MHRLLLWTVLILAGDKLIVPVPRGTVDLGGRKFDIVFLDAVYGPAEISHGAIRIVPVASKSLCGSDGANGQIVVSSSLTPKQQAKALLHEVIHIAQSCDNRRLPVDERIAQDVSDLLDSSEGPFILKELAEGSDRRKP